MKNHIIALLTLLVMSVSMHAQTISKSSHYTAILNLHGPDLVVTQVKMPYVAPQFRLYTGNTIKIPIEVTIKNKGNEEARSGFGIHTSLKVQGNKTDGETIVRLAPNQSRTLKMTAHINASLNGRYVRFLATVDPPGGGRIPEQGAPKGGVVHETNENNNTRAVNIKLPVYTRLNPKNLD
ncbi:MAG: hypothetical protein KDC80_11070 [Saprospiraceae bacterium]|nr:hypothetical protein [Saprospiraceae bacterium]